jgi:hypothetical protein
MRFSRRFRYGIVLVALAISSLMILYWSYSIDYDAIQSLVVNMYPRYVTVQPSEVIFIVTLTMVSAKPAFEDTKITNVRISVVVDSLQAGTVTVPFDMRVGGWVYSDIAYDARFNLTGSSLETFSQHSSHVFVMTVHFLAQNNLYEQQLTRTQIAAQ